MTSTDDSVAVSLNDIDLGNLSGIRLIIPDMHGVPRSKTVLPQTLARIVENGHPWAPCLFAADLWQNITPESMESLGTGNTQIRPVMETFTRLPWHPSTAVVVCEPLEESGPALTPRAVLQRVLDLLAQYGYKMQIGAELEFFVYSETDGAPPFGMREWYTSQATSKVRDFVEDLEGYLPEMGLPLYEVFNEHAAGQMELNMLPAFGVSAIDRFLIMKLAIKEIAALHGLHATMMCKPSNDPECATSGLHVHQTLHQDGRNAFQTVASDRAGLSDLASHYIAGQLEHAAGTTAFAAPTINAYKRYRPGTWAPTRKAWGIDNRTAMVRAIVAAENTRIENRTAASDANGYLIVAAQASAGLDGIRRELVPPDAASHDVSEDRSYESIPTNLLDAVRELEADVSLCDDMGSEFCEHFIGMARQIWERYQAHVSDWEIAEYDGIL